MSDLTDAIALLERRGYTVLSPLGSAWCHVCDGLGRVAKAIRTDMPGRIHLMLESEPCPKCKPLRR